MATAPRPRVGRQVDYPTSDGRPMAETDVHRDLMMDLILTLNSHYEADPMVYVSGNLMLFYEEGNKRKHISPDVFVVRGVAKGRRDYYLLWEERRGPDLVIEITSKTTRSEDVKKKLALYRDVLQVPEYFLFDPLQDYLKPSMQATGWSMGNTSRSSRSKGGCRAKRWACTWSGPGSNCECTTRRPRRWLPNYRELVAGNRLRVERAEADAEHERRVRAEAEVEVLTERLRAERAEMEIARLRRELEELRRSSGG